MARLHVGRNTARGRFALILLPAVPRRRGEYWLVFVFATVCATRRYRSPVYFHDLTYVCKIVRYPTDMAGSLGYALLVEGD